MFGSSSQPAPTTPPLPTLCLRLQALANDAEHCTGPDCLSSKSSPQFCSESDDLSAVQSRRSSPAYVRVGDTIGMSPAATPAGGPAAGGFGSRPPPLGLVPESMPLQSAGSGGTPQPMSESEAGASAAAPAAAQQDKTEAAEASESSADTHAAGPGRFWHVFHLL